MSAPEDLAAFCRREYPRLVGALDLYVGDLYVAEELAQEAMVRAGQRWSKVSQLESPGGWTYRVAIDLAKLVPNCGSSWRPWRGGGALASDTAQPRQPRRRPVGVDHQLTRYRAAP